MKKIVLFLATVALGLHSLSAQMLETTSFAESVSRCFVDYYTGGGAQEKLYLTTDKPYYSAGDKIYYSIFLVNSIFFDRYPSSRFVYVELIDAMGNIVSRQKLMGESGRFSNAISLSAKMNSGRYTLRAYTRWQTNFDEKLLFERRINIGNYIDDVVRTSVTYDFDGSGRVVASVEVTNNLFEPIASHEVEYMLRINGRTTQHFTKTDRHGMFRFVFKPTDDATDCVRFNISAGGRKLDRQVQLPSFKDDFSASFLPEGGNLVAGIEQVVAFRAEGVDGYSVEVEGEVRNRSGEKICAVASQHNGMGKFSIVAKSGEKYSVVLRTKEGVMRTFALPEPQLIGCVMRYDQLSSKEGELKVSTTAGLPIESLALVIQSRGLVSYVVEDLTRPIRISYDKLRSGVAQLSIIDKNTLQVVAERLFFVRGAVAKATITPSVARFSPRENVSLDVNVCSSDGKGVKGSFAVSVTDFEVVGRDENCDNILSYIFLNSDLRGHIEKPTYYFEADDKERNEGLDLVMLTHGWRRYNTDDILAKRKPKVRYAAEEEQHITGSVTGTLGKVRNPSVMIFRNRKEYMGVYPLNNTNCFDITGIDLRDTTAYYIQALNREGSSSRVRIKVDPQTFPMTPALHREVFRKRTFSSVPEALLMRSKQNYYDDGGIPVIDIEEVVVTAERINTYSYSSSLTDFNTVSGDMTRFVSIYDALQRFRELVVDGNNVYVASSRIQASPVSVTQSENDDNGGTSDVEVNMEEKTELMPDVYINGTQMDMGMIDAYPMSEVVSVSYLNKFEATTAGISSENGAIILQVKNINAREKFLINSMAEVVVPGYAPPVEFYAPNYAVENDKSKRDSRTTIAWEPNLVSNMLGDASMSFWTTDRSSDYRVVIEGLTIDGELLYEEVILRAK